MRIPSATSLALLACSLALASSAAIAADAVYKWKDANGQSHYSQSPPPSGTKYETINPIGGPSSAPAAATVSTAGSSAAPAPASTAFKPAETRNSEASSALRQKNCATAKANAATLQNNPGANTYSAGGKSEAMSAERRAAELARANQMVTQYCGGN